MASVGTIKYKNGSSWIDILHPVNSFYFSYASTSPANLFGGTWTQVTNAALRGATNVGYTGSDSHTLTVDEIPAHAHIVTSLGYNMNNGTNTHGSYWGGQNINNHPVTNYVGGGQHTQSCNVPSTVISGIVLHKSKRVVVM